MVTNMSEIRERILGRATVKLPPCAEVVCSGGITNSSEVLLIQFVNMARFEW